MDRQPVGEGDAVIVAEWEHVIDDQRRVGVTLMGDGQLVVIAEDPGAFTFVEVPIGVARELRDALTDLIARSEGRQNDAHAAQ